MGAEFVLGFVRSITGERDPRCLIIVFRLFCKVVQLFSMGKNSFIHLYSSEPFLCLSHIAGQEKGRRVPLPHLKLDFRWKKRNSPLLISTRNEFSLVPVNFFLTLPIFASKPRPFFKVSSVLRSAISAHFRNIQRVANSNYFLDDWQQSSLSFCDHFTA